MTNDYHEYYGCFAVYQDRQIVGVYDLPGPMDIPWIGDEMHTCVKCGNCDCWMEHKKKSWKCPKCGTSVTQSKVYEAIDVDNRKSLEDYEDYY